MWSEAKEGEKEKKTIDWVWQKLVDFLVYTLKEVCDTILSLLPRTTPSNNVSRTSNDCEHEKLIHLWDGYDYKTDRWECEYCGIDIPEEF